MLRRDLIFKDNMKKPALCFYSPQACRRRVGFGGHALLLRLFLLPTLAHSHILRCPPPEMRPLRRRDILCTGGFSRRSVHLRHLKEPLQSGDTSALYTLALSDLPAFQTWVQAQNIRILRTYAPPALSS